MMVIQATVPVSLMHLQYFFLGPFGRTYHRDKFCSIYLRSLTAYSWTNGRNELGCRMSNAVRGVDCGSHFESKALYSDDTHHILLFSATVRSSPDIREKFTQTLPFFCVI